MKKEKMEKIKKLNEEWLNELKNEENLRYLMYEPFNKYWEENYKIVWCNLEPGGAPENKDETTLSIDTLKYWFNNSKSPTIKHTSLFIYCLFNKLEGHDVNKDEKENVKNDCNLLMNYIERITYMNLLKDCGEPEFSEQYFKKFFSGEKGKKDKKKTKEFIEILNPDIFIVTGIGKELIEELFNNKFDDKHSFVYNNILFMNLGHPRDGIWNLKDWEKSYIYNNVNLLKENLMRYKLEK